jgi:hypothetical protein
MFCPNCGNQNDKSKSNCFKCGWGFADKVNKKVLLQSTIDAQEDHRFVEGFHSLIDKICGLDLECGPNVSIRFTIERIENEDSTDGRTDTG